MRVILTAMLAAVLASAACASAPRAEPAIRVLVFNIHAGKDAAGRPNLEDVAALVRSTGADLVLLQEVDRGTRRSGHVDQLDVLGRLTAFHAAFGRSLDYDGGLYGIAALSRAPIASHETEALPVEPPQARAGGRYEPRAALMLRTTTAIGPLQALNTHLDASRDEHYRLQESRHILLLADRLLASGIPVIAGGDFNAEPDSDTYRQLVSGRLKDAWTECGTGDGFTFPASAPVKRIDYLFMTKDLRCTAAEVIDTRISDHRPLLVTVSR
ncbi:MAG TPA: endonuclease/exonuclease/phosphatase family protein [Vicinamibacterales bacterium]|nr:endonuclease/exonuclease/phosphatase family protein [Vicinamibacterales bacterium]